MADTVEVKPLTFEEVQKMSGEEMQKTMKTRRAELDAVLLAETKRVEDRLSADNDAFIKAQEDKAEAEAKLEAEALEAAKSPEEKAAEEAAAAAKIAEEVAAKAEQERQAAEAAEAERKILEAKAAEEVKPKEKIVLDFQATDDDGQPIGRRTHLEADSYEEMQEKMKDSYINAVRYAERMKKRAAIKPQFKQEEAPIVTLDEAQLLEIQKDLESKDEIVVAKAKIKLDLDEAAKLKKQAHYQADYNKGQAVSLQFRNNHPEFNNCDANVQIIKQYFETENLEWTLENLEYTYAQVESQLAPRQSAVQPEPSPAPVKEDIKQEVAAANPPAASASVVAPAPVQETAPAVPTTVETVPAATNTPAVTTKPPASGIEPGSLHGGRPEVGTTKPAGLTKKQILAMPREEYKKRMRDPGFVRQVNILFKDGR